MPISPESQYLLDGAVELFLLTVDVYEYAFYDQLNVDGIVDELERSELPRDYRSSPLYDIINHQYENWYNNQASMNERAYVNAKLVFDSEMQVKDLVHHISDILSGSMLGVKYFKEKYNLTIKDEKDLYNPEFLLQILDQEPNLEKWCSRFGSSFDRAKAQLIDTNMNKFLGWLSIYNRQRAALIQNQMQLSEPELITIPKNVHRENKKKIQRGRKALVRSLNLFQKILGKDKVSMFLNGYDFIIEGKLFNYRISKSDRTKILSHTIEPTSVHIPYELEILTKEHNVVLCNACLIFDNTPVIDQIVALAMHIKTDNEEQLLKTANMFSRTPDYYKNESMVRIKQITPPKTNPDGTPSVIDLRNPFDIFETGRQAHDEMQIWRQRIKPKMIKNLENYMNIPAGQLSVLENPKIKFDQLETIQPRELRTIIRPLLK